MNQKLPFRPSRTTQDRILCRFQLRRIFLSALQAGSSLVCSLLVGLTLFAVAVPVTMAQRVQISVDATKAGAKIDRSIFGQLWLAITNVDPNQSAEIELTLAGVNAKSAAGETLSAQKVDSVNIFDAANTVIPKPISAKVQDGKLTLKLESKSVTVVAVEQ